MKHLTRISILLLAASLLLCACGRDPLGADGIGVYIYLDIEAPLITKAGVGNVPADLAEESSIKDLRIWVFRHSDGQPLGYLQPTAAKGDDPLTQHENKYFVPLTPEIAEAHPTVDLYAIGNAPALGLSALGESTSRDQLDALMLEGGYFGINDAGNPTRTSVPGDGLPFSGMGRNLEMKGDYPVMSVDVVTLRRSVSKFRFIFCQLKDEVGPMIDNFTISELSLDAGVLPKQEYLFFDPADGYHINGETATGGGYEEHPIVFTPPTYSDVASNPAPEEFVFNSGQSATDYNNKLQEGLKSGVLTEWGRCYLRESDRRLQGHMTYSIAGGEHKTAQFQMDAAGDFTRGRSWVVYIYFLRDAMQFDVHYTPWGQSEDNEYNLTPGE